MKITYFIGLAFSCFIALSVVAENGHQLWLRGKSTSNVQVTYTKKSPTLDIAAQELRRGWQGQANDNLKFTVKADKLIKGDGFKLSSGEIQAEECPAAVQVKMAPLSMDEQRYLKD